MEWFDTDELATNDQDRGPADTEEVQEGGFHSYFKYMVQQVVCGKDQLSMNSLKQVGFKGPAKEEFFWQVLDVFKNVNYFNLLSGKF